MPAIDPDDLPKRKGDFRLVEDLDSLSIVELDQRIELLTLEIARIEAVKQKKQGLRSTADDFFRKG